MTGTHPDNAPPIVRKSTSWSHASFPRAIRLEIDATRGIVMRSLAVPYAMSPVPSARR